MFKKTCTCPDAWCQLHAECPCGAMLVIDDPDGLAFCPDCKMDRMPVGACDRKMKRQ